MNQNLFKILSVLSLGFVAYIVFRDLKTDQLPGGMADEIPDSEFDQNNLSAGIAVEMEHTSDYEIAKEIAKDHLTEDPDYYEKLIKAGL